MRRSFYCDSKTQKLYVNKYRFMFPATANIIKTVGPLNRT